jgi:Trk K+ transport system NAD-binding subunit
MMIPIVPVGTGRGGYVNADDIAALVEEGRNGRTVTRIVLRNGHDVLTCETADEVVERMGGEYG